MNQPPPRNIIDALTQRPGWQLPPRWRRLDPDHTTAPCDCPAAPVVPLKVAKLYVGTTGFLWHSGRCPSCGCYAWCMTPGPDEGEG